MTVRFHALDRATQLYKECKNLKLENYIRLQLLREMSSVALNLSEGNYRQSTKDRLRFFNYAFTSLKEVQQIFELEDIHYLRKEADQLAAMIYVMNRNLTDTANRSRNGTRPTSLSLSSG